ncbi:MAG: LCP family protein [Candidatus Daviesbacteria bacterium]
MEELKQLKIKNINHKNQASIKIVLALFLAVACILIWIWWQSSSSFSVFNFVFGKESGLKTDEGRINVLLLGMAGGMHEGATLTDTVIVASYNRKTSEVDLISIPRDLWLDKYKAKVNTLYQTGLSQGNGLDFVQKEIGEILGIKIPYGSRLDFSGFVKAVDLIGGIKVNVERSFDDYRYPIEGKGNELCGYQEAEMEVSTEDAARLNVSAGKQKVLLDPENKIATASGALDKNLSFSQDDVFKFFPCRYEHVGFTQGETQMDGETALKFVRSRSGTNNEGTDFARSKRQQLVLQTFKDKVLSAETWTDLEKIVGLIKTFGESFDSNIPQSQYLEFIKMSRKVKEVKSFVLDSKGDNSLLIVPEAWEYGAWVLIPPDNDFSKIHKYIDDIFSGKIESSPSAQEK